MCMLHDKGKQRHVRRLITNFCCLLPAPNGVELECFKLHAVYHRRAHDLHHGAAQCSQGPPHLLAGLVQSRLSIRIAKQWVCAMVQPASTLTRSPTKEHANAQSERSDVCLSAVCSQNLVTEQSCERTAAAQQVRGQRRLPDAEPRLHWIWSDC